MENRKRNGQIILRVTEEERAWARVQKLRKNKRRPTRTGQSCDCLAKRKLAVDGKLASYGKVPKKDEAKAILQKIRANT